MSAAKETTKQEKAEPVAAEPVAVAAPDEKPAKKKRKRKYKRGSIPPWERPSLSDGSADEGNALDEWEDEYFADMCLCEPQPYLRSDCTCGCVVTYTRSQWKQHKAKHGLAPPGGWK